jgi:hypothetical protein
MIRDAGFDGAGVRFIDPAFAAQVTSFLRKHGMIWQTQCYPTNVDDLKPVLELVARLGADHVNLQPNVRPHRLEACIPAAGGCRVVQLQAEFAAGDAATRRRLLQPAHAKERFENYDPDASSLSDADARLLIANQEGYAYWGKYERLPPRRLGGAARHRRRAQRRHRDVA